jgi:hypothetical protein
MLMLEGTEFAQHWANAGVADTALLAPPCLAEWFPVVEVRKTRMLHAPTAEPTYWKLIR